MMELHWDSVRWACTLTIASCFFSEYCVKEKVFHKFHVPRYSKVLLPTSVFVLVNWSNIYFNYTIFVPSISVFCMLFSWKSSLYLFLFSNKYMYNVVILTCCLLAVIKNMIYDNLQDLYMYTEVYTQSRHTC